MKMLRLQVLVTAALKAFNRPALAIHPRPVRVCPPVQCPNKRNDNLGRLSAA